jgi:aminopeptidase N
VDWYAYVAPYRNGWLVHDPGYWGEFQVFDTGDFHVELTLANNPAGLIVAASALPSDTVQAEGTTYRYQLASARTFALSISPSYKVFSQTVALDSGSVVVYSYAYAFDVEAGKAALVDTANAVQLYSELFGAYPHASLSVVEADFLDGMEYEGLYFLSKGFYNLYDGTPNGYLTAIAVHETAHQWFYGLVGNDQARAPWLDEALCAFTERVYYEHYYPDALTRWWQPYRVDYYEPAGRVDGSINDYASYRAYRDGVYLHGQEFLQAMRLRLGDQAFFAFLKDYVARYRGQIATRQDFFTLLAAHSPVEIDDLVEEYFGK